MIGIPDKRVILTVATVAIILVAVAILLPLRSFLGSGSGQQTSSIAAHFTIVMSNAGFNGSANHPPQEAWPVMKVVKGQTVTIRVVNNDPVEAHGFAATHYFDGGVALRPHEFYDLTFVADQTGTFRVYCNIFCAIHPLMQNGQLVVG